MTSCRTRSNRFERFGAGIAAGVSTSARHTTEGRRTALTSAESRGSTSVVVRRISDTSRPPKADEITPGVSRNIEIETGCK